MEHAPKPYPIDYDKLAKGDVLTASEIEEITGQRQGSDRYRFAQLGLRSTIMDVMRERGYPVTVVCQGDDLCILTDSEAAVHNRDVGNQRIRQFQRSVRRLAEVDRCNLGEEQRIEWEADVINHSRLLQAISKERRSIAIESEKRAVPGVIGN